jgi:HAD superfamily hydrolase (TIGR01509 family)
MKVILLGGTQGTSKNKIASKLAKKLNISHVISTEAIKEIIKSVISRDQLPSLYDNVLNIKNNISGDDNDKIWGYMRQTMDLKSGIEAVINNSNAYKDTIIIEGIHLIPGILSLKKDIKLYHFILEMPGEETHARALNENIHHSKSKDFSKIRAYQDYLIEQSKGHGAIVLSSENIESCLNQILSLLGRRVIVFDLLGVVFPNKAGGSIHNIEKLYQMLPNKPMSFDNFYKRYLDYMLGKITRDEFWQKTSSNYAAIEEKYLETYAFDSNLVELIQDHNDDYRFVALTNQPREWIEYLTNKFELNKFFEKIYTSGELKMKKPQKAIYKMILQDAHIQPSDVIIIDDQKKNLKAANALGLKTVYINNHSDFDEFEPDMSVNSILELNNKLNEL